MKAWNKLRAAGVFAVLLTMVLTSGGCGRSEKKGQIIVTPTPTVSDGGKVSKTPKEQAMDAYREILTAAPAIAGAQDILADITLRYEQNLEMFGDHVERYAYYDLNRDEIPELIALSVVNARWTPVSVYTYADGKAVLLEDPSDPEAHGTFEQSSLSNGAYLLYFCKENHIHNVWRGVDPFGGAAEENHAYELAGTELKEVACDLSEDSPSVPFDDIAENNAAKERDIPAPTPEPKKEIRIDYYRLPEVYSKFLSEEEISFYRKLVTAWLNYEPKVPYDDYDKQINHVWGMIQECFFLAYGDFDEEKGFTVDDRYVYFPYVSKSKEEHDRIIAEFEERVQTFFQGISEQEEGYELARHIYINYNKTIAYDYDVSESGNHTFENSSGYTAIMKGTGVCSSFAKGYTFLARLAGLEAFDVSGIGYPAAHEWGALKIGDKYYFADPTWDYTSDPLRYRYFCFGLDQREADGYPEDKMSLCCCGDFKMSDYVTIERKGYE